MLFMSNLLVLIQHFEELLVKIIKIFDDCVYPNSFDVLDELFAPEFDNE